MGFQHESGHEAIRFNAEGVSGAAALGSYLLRFSVSFTLAAWKTEFGSVESTFHNFHARAELEPDRLRLGCPRAEVPLVITAHEHQQSGTLAFELQVPASIVEKIEQFRAGGGLDVKMHISGERMGLRHATEYDDVYYRISQSQWIDVLRQMNFGDYLLCELPIELGDDGELRDVWAFMTEARELIYNGHYSSAVLECRKAFETTVKHFNLEASLSRAAVMNRESHRSMPKRERFLNLYDAAKRATNLSAHPDANNEVVDYSRREALLVFAVVAAAIAEISERPEFGGETG